MKRSWRWNGYPQSRCVPSCILLFENNTPGTIPGAMLLRGTCSQNAFNSFLWHRFFLRDLQRELVCMGRVCSQSLGLISEGSYCSSDSGAASESFESNRAALTLRRCYLPGKACWFKGILGNKDFLGKQSLKSCVGALTFSVGHQGEGCQPPRSANLLSLFQRQSLLSAGLCIQSDECGNSDCMTWELWLVVRLSDPIRQCIVLTLLRSLLGQYSSTVPRTSSQLLKF